MSSLEERAEWRRNLITLTFLLLFFNIIDIIVTTYIVENGGTEINPVVNFAWENIGVWSVIVAKLFLPLLLGMFCVWWTKHPILFYNKILRFMFMASLIILNMIYFGVVIFISYQLMA